MRDIMISLAPKMYCATITKRQEEYQYAPKTSEVLRPILAQEFQYIVFENTRHFTTYTMVHIFYNDFCRVGKFAYHQIRFRQIMCIVRSDHDKCRCLDTIQLIDKERTVDSDTKTTKKSVSSSFFALAMTPFLFSSLIPSNKGPSK